MAIFIKDDSNYMHRYPIMYQLHICAIKSMVSSICSSEMIDDALLTV